jgi:hypothetical protein
MSYTPRDKRLEFRRGMPYQHPIHPALLLAVLALADLVTTFYGIKQGIPELWPTMASNSLLTTATLKSLEALMLLLVGVWFTTAPVRARRWFYIVVGLLCVVQALVVFWNILVIGGAV